MVEEWQKVLLKALMNTYTILVLDEIKKHCNCPYIDQKINELRQELEQIRQKYVEKAKKQ